MGKQTMSKAAKRASTKKSKGKVPRKRPSGKKPRQQRSGNLMAFLERKAGTKSWIPIVNDLAAEIKSKQITWNDALLSIKENVPIGFSCEAWEHLKRKVRQARRVR